jgi:NAD(P)-dependent dehydrogenase (short-subunit alcohol dehydrogenase family)
LHRTLQSFLPQRLAGKVAIITGAASGIGHATAQLFADEWVTAIAVGGPSSPIMDAHEGRPQIVPLAQDVTAEEAPFVIVDVALPEAGGADILFNNAGVSNYTVTSNGRAVAHGHALPGFNHEPR